MRFRQYRFPEIPTALATLLLLALIPIDSGARRPEPHERVVWVHFVDRGPIEALSAAEKERMARAHLSARSLERRARRAGLMTLESDLPVYDGYVEELRAQGYEIRAVSRWLNAASVITTPHTRAALRRLWFVERTSAVPRVRRIEGDGVEAPVEPAAAGRRAPRAPGLEGAQQPFPGDPAFYGGSWEQHRIIGADQLHAMGLTGQGVLITVVDTGFLEVHSTFDSLDVLARRDFIQGDETVSNQPTLSPTDAPSQHNHGSYVLSVISGNSPGTHMGIAWGAQVALAKTEYVASETPAEMDYWQMAAEWADSLGADILTTSLGYTTFDNPADDYTYADMDGNTTPVTIAADEAARRGIFVVASVGNAGNSSWHYLIAPADGDSVCAVGAVDSLGQITSFSSFGPSFDGRVKPDVCAIGFWSQVGSIADPTTYIRVNGTSFSAPAIAGLAALLLESNAWWGPFELLEALRMTADRYETPDDQYGYGIAQGVAANEFVPSTVAVGRSAGGARLGFAGAHPSPGGTRLELAMGEVGGNARLDLYDVRGRRIRTLFSGHIPAGDREVVRWDGSSEDGAVVGGGVYLARFRGPGFEITRRIVALP